MGVFLEYNRKTEPGSADYMGNFNFGHNANNPLSTGNGYANMLLGVFTTYTELTNRVDRDVRHWQNDVYIQDNWRVNPRLTIDYGLRIQHSGSYFEVNEMNSGFFTDQWSRSQAARVYRLVCMDGRPGNQACRGEPAADDRSGEPRTSFFPARSTATSCRAAGNQINGISDRRDRGQKAGHLLHVPVLHVRAARRVRLEHVRGRQDGAARLVGDLLQLPAGERQRRQRSTGAGGYAVLGRLPDLLHAADPLGDVRRHHDARRRATWSRTRRT